MPGFLRLPATLRQVASDLLFLRPGILASEDARGLLAEEHGVQDVKARPFSRQGRRLWRTMGILGLLVSCAGLLISKRPAANLEVSAPNEHLIPQENHFLHILLPTRLSPLETCRTIVSGAALNYPNPWAISWNVEFDDDMRERDSYLAKLESILAFLELQEPERNADTVIILANPGSWFQVRPEVLLKRYRSIQQEPQRQSLRQNASREAYELQHVKSKIVLSVERSCLSKEGADCLPVQAEDNTPRFVSHNFAIGPVQELRLFYRDAVAEAQGLEEHHSPFDEHSVFARIYSSLQHINSAPKGYTLALDLLDRLSFAATSDTSFESQAKSSTGQGVDLWKHKSATRLTEDIRISESPFRSLPDLSHTSWKDASFLTPKKAVTVPAIVQQSAEFDFSLSQEWYEHLWFHPHGEKLIQSYPTSTDLPVASFLDSDGVQQRYYSPHPGGVAAVAANKDLHPWSEICEGQDFTNSLFGEAMAG